MDVSLVSRDSLYDIHREVVERKPHEEPTLYDPYSWRGYMGFYKVQGKSTRPMKKIQLSPSQIATLKKKHELKTNGRPLSLSTVMDTRSS